MGEKNGGKTREGAGISAAELSGLRQRVERLEKQLSTGPTEALLTGWVGQSVRMTLPGGFSFSGVLKWVDKYNYCVLQDGFEHLISKSGVSVMKREVEGETK